MKTFKFICLCLIVFVGMGITIRELEAMTVDSNDILPVYADTTLSKTEIYSLKQAIDIWNSTESGQFFEYKGKVISKWYFLVDSKVVVVTKGKTDEVDTLADTSTDIGKYVSRSLITINEDVNFGGNGYNLTSIFVHELFHTKGINIHTDDPNSTFNSRYTGKTTFTAEDKNLINGLRS